MSLRRSILVVLAVLGALLLAILLYLAFGDLSRHKGRIEALVTEGIGRPFAIDGAFELKVLPQISVLAERVRLGNAPGGSAPQMVEIGRVSAQIGLWSLISGPVDIRTFELSDVAVVLEKDAEGKGNWVFGGEAEAEGKEADSHGMDATAVPAVVLRAKLDNLRVTYREPGKPQRVALLETFTIESAADGLFAVAGKGKLDDYPATLAGDVGPLSALVSGRDIRMAMQASLGNLRLDLKGALGRLDPLDGADLTLKIDNPDLGGMLKKLQLPVFATGALSFDARLSDAGELTRLEANAKFGDISARVDGTLRVLGLTGSDLRFEVSVADAARLAAAFGVDGLPTGVAKASGRVASSRTEIKLDGISAQYAGAKATADGTIRTSGKQGAAIRFKVAAESLATLRAGLPAMPMQMSASYAGSSAKIEVKDLKARVGGNEIAASASMTRTGKRRFEADVTSPVLDLTPFLTETKATTKTKPPPKQVATKFVFGEEPLPLGMLKGPDTRLHLAIGELKLGAGGLKDVDGTLRLGAGQLALEGRARGGVDGSLSGSVVLSQQGGGAAALDLNITATRFRAGFGAGGEIQPGETPPTSVAASLQTRGASARQMAAGAKGRFLVTLGPGRVKAGMLDLLGSGLIGELAGKLNPFAAQDPYTRLDCAVSRADVVDGHVTLSPVLLQIEKVTVVAHGTVDLHSEALALNFNTRPRKGIGISPGMFTNPFIEVAGTLVNPRIGVSAKGVTAGAAAAATGGATVVAQGFWDRMRGEKDLCGPVLAEAGATPK